MKDFYVSVLESSSATKRDAKVYLQTFGPTVTKPQSVPANSINIDPLTNGARAISEAPRFVQGSVAARRAAVEALPHVAVIKFRRPQDTDDATLLGVAKTLAQLRALGLLSVIVLDCELSIDDKQWSRTLNRQIYRLAGAIDEYGEPWTTIANSALSRSSGPHLSSDSSLRATEILVNEDDSVLAALSKGSAVIVSPVVQQDDATTKAVNPDQVIVAIAKFLSGIQFATSSTTEDGLGAQDVTQPTKKASVDRVIILDPLGGIPSKDRWNNAHVFLNLEDELESAKKHLRSLDFSMDTSATGADAKPVTDVSIQPHLHNLELAKQTLAILPSTSSALITTPMAAANLHPQSEDGNALGFVGSVGTRRRHNPLIHNLLTDRPSHSSSLPLGRITPITRTTDPASNPVMSPTTLAKRGMPVTVYPDATSTGWTPPHPSQPRLKLTDTCVDLPRLVHLIEDSFGRKLDVQDYLARVESSLAGIIIAGEYEGGAILTWERPFGMNEAAAYESGRLVPYLDKFAVLKKSQGAGGVADIVFNAMVRDCFPEGVCWRSRKNNPVNKWYFERSRGTMKLPESNWSMFWTTPGLMLKDELVRDYEDVCRNIQPSWADNKGVVD